MHQEHPLASVRRAKNIPLYALRELLIDRFGRKICTGTLSMTLNGYAKMSPELEAQITAILTDEAAA
jgi:hypothetical protein